VFYADAVQLATDVIFIGKGVAIQGGKILTGAAARSFALNAGDDVARVSLKGGARRGAAGAASLFGAGDDAVRAVGYIKPKPGFFDVILHGTENGFGVYQNGVWHEVSHRSLASFMKKNGYNGPPRYFLWVV
jgi:hypothetical protein